MPFDFSNEQKLVQHEIQKFAGTQLNPIAGDIDKHAVFPRDIMQRLAELGFLGILIEEGSGGAGLDVVSLCIILNELSRECASVGTAVAVHSCLVSYPIQRYAPADLKKELQGLASGEIGAFSPELEFGGDDNGLEIRTTDEGVVANGTRLFVFNGENARCFIVPVAHDGNLLHLFRRDNTIETQPQYLLGLRAAGIVSVRFNNSVTSGQGFVGLHDAAGVLRDIYGFADLGFSAVALGIAEACLAAAIAYSRERRQFNKAIGEFPMVREMLVEMKSDIEAARLLVYRAARLCDRSEDYVMAAHIARLHACTTAVKAGTRSVQIHGGYGYIKDYPVERYFRDAKALQVLLRSPHDTKAIIAKEMLV